MVANFAKALLRIAPAKHYCKSPSNRAKAPGGVNGRLLEAVSALRLPQWPQVAGSFPHLPH